MKCYEQRLRKTMEYALKNRFKLFTTTLTISPHKSSRIIFEIGKRLAMDKNIDFLQRDFKKKGGFNVSVRMSKEMGLYRQNYCGCEFSR